jgi:putative ABC transport system permease protein
MVSDFRQAVRTLSKSPGFSALVVAVLAVGIGANTAIFSIVNGVLLKPLPFAGASRIVAVDTTLRNQPGNTSYPDFLDWHAQATGFDRLAAYSGAIVTLTGAGDAVAVPCTVVSPDLLPMLGVAPLRGRLFGEDDDKPGAPRTAILTESLWTTRFSRDEATIGKTIVLDGDPFLVVGIMPRGFEFPFDAEEPAQLWMPVRASRYAGQWADLRSASFMKGIGRLREGVSLATAQAEMTTIANRLAAQYPRNQSRGVLVRPFQEVLVKNYRLGLLVLLSAVASVLLIACANVANLLLARGSTRTREIAIRSALGASRTRIVRQLLFESLLLALVGGMLGADLAAWGVKLLVRVSPLQIPRLQDVHVDQVALVFTALTSILIGTLSGFAPALQFSRANAGEALKDGERSGAGISGSRMRRALVVAEMALSLVLLAAAGLLARSLFELQRVNPGFITERAVAMQLMLPATTYPDSATQRSFYRRLSDRVTSLPGLSAAALSSTLPLTGSDIDVGFVIEGRPVDPTTREGAPGYAVSPDYFSAMGISLVKGRRFTERDDEQHPDVVIVNETMAAKYWPNEDPIGKRITLSLGRTGPREIVGVVTDVKQATLADRAKPQMYTPFVQTPWPFLSVVVRTTAAEQTAAASLRRALADVDAMQAPGEIRTLEEYISRTVATPRFTAFLIGAFAVFALALAGFGLFSVMAYSVAQRRREIGIRMALGAQPGDVRTMVVSQAVRLGAVGLGVGLAGALAVTRVLDTLLYGVQPHDPVTLAAVSCLLLAVMLVAAYLPARRATRVDPIIALRTE